MGQQCFIFFFFFCSDYNFDLRVHITVCKRLKIFKQILNFFGFMGRYSLVEVTILCTNGLYTIWRFSSPGSTKVTNQMQRFLQEIPLIHSQFARLFQE